MKTTTKFLFSLLLLGITFSSCKEQNKKNEKTKVNQSTKSKDFNRASEMNPFQVIPRDFRNTDEAQKYSDNLLVVVKDSYFEYVKNNSGKVIDTVINLKISVPNDKYRLRSAFNLFKIQTGTTKAIAVHITDKTIDKACGAGVAKLLDLKIPINEILGHSASGKKLQLNMGDQLMVGVINESIPDFTQSGPYILARLENDFRGPYNFFCKDFPNRKKDSIDGTLAYFQPKEGGGGVIIEGP